MRWDRSHESPNLEDRRGWDPPRGGGLGMGGFSPFGLFALLGRFGWKGILIGLVLVGLLTYGGGASMCAGGGAPPRSSQVQEGGKVESSPAEDERIRFVGFVFDDVQQTFRSKLAGFEDAKLVVFRDAVESACGTTSSAAGPFYCPNDHRVYIDLGFYDELARRFGAPGDFAQAYVIAHEVGHHVQNLSGNIGGGRSNRESVAVELQADCLAGVWARSAEGRGLLEVGDVDEALGAASAIGDDVLQRQSQGRVTPETWTHGSAAQRSAAWRRGYQGGDLAACDR